ncbi:MAG: hypothetical protein CVU00_11055 [Bacteroidetes bacterium HGW-Bacteroidetes-17]|jgi:outer membrane cobalamin receptor|nr:MAG: hypothetical protein CVU00_11055 [Bacteroidetes bacterium HGW-Bacteroidetes-17]
MFFKKFGVTVLAIFSGLLVHGQVGSVDSSIMMNEVVISANRLQNFAVGSNIQKIDSLVIANYNNQSFAELLTAQSLVSINSYGSAGLASPSIRGGGTNHTAVIWNGVNIQSPMNGGTNMALFPVSMIGDVTIQFGGSGTLVGSGAMSGAIHLESLDLFQKENQVFLSLGSGSFGAKNLNAGVNIGMDKLAASLRFYHNEALNDFRFTNIAKYQMPKETQTNADFDQSGFIFENKIRTSKNAALSATFWYQKYDKKIQTLMIDSDTAKSFQSDKNIYSVIRWQRTGKYLNVLVKSAIINNVQRFTNPNLPDPVSNNSALSFINEIEGKWVINEFQLLDAGINYTYDEVSSAGYKSLASRNRMSVFMSHKFVLPNNKLSVVNSIRKEIVDDGNLPFVYSMDVDYAINKNYTAKGNVSKNYSLPTLNDLFWRSETFVSGNPNLKAESGFSGEIGFSETISLSQPSIKFEQSFYYSRINNWIVWLPNERGVWTPENKNTAKIKGLDLNLYSDYTIGKVRLNLNAKFNWNSSRFKDEDPEYLPMIYVPKNIFMFSIGAKFKNLNISYDHKYNSKKYYDQTHFLTSFHLAGLSIQYQLPSKQNSLFLSFKINNIWNENYQVMAWYAMPPINYLFSISYHLNKFLTLK